MTISLTLFFNGWQLCFKSEQQVLVDNSVKHCYLSSRRGGRLIYLFARAVIIIPIGTIRLCAGPFALVSTVCTATGRAA